MDLLFVPMGNPYGAPSPHDDCSFSHWVIGVNEGQSRVNDDPGTEFMAILTETVSRACTL